MNLTGVSGIAANQISGVYVNGDHNNIDNNLIYMNIPDKSDYHKGLNIYVADKNKISNNIINLTNNTATDIGIELSNEASLNSGNGNITKNCGVSISDLGINNQVVVATDM
jgi:hypothetical protein